MNTKVNMKMHGKKDKHAPRLAVGKSLPEKPAADSIAPVISAKTISTQRARFKSEVAPALSGKRRTKLKETFVRSPKPQTRKEIDMPEMEPPRGRRGPEGEGAEPGYLVLRMRLYDGRLRVIAFQLMPGPLVADRALVGSHAYEVVISGRMVHVGSLPDLGIQRSFVNPQATEGVETGHHIAERKTVDFTVRVPAGEVTPETLAQVEVVLLRVKRGITVDRLDDESVSKRFERELRPVARLSGLPNEALPDAVRARGQPTRPR